MYKIIDYNKNNDMYHSKKGRNYFSTNNNELSVYFVFGQHLPGISKDIIQWYVFMNDPVSRGCDKYQYTKEW